MLSLRRSLPLLFVFILQVGWAGLETASLLLDQEIPRSPRVTWGTLENGLTYAILPHASPPHRVSLRLIVKAGSLHESDDERGFAHFVEHMAFNGTKNFRAGELVKVLQRQGAGFGPHVNALTSPTHTIYKLDLPKSSPETVATGVRILRDFADGLLFELDEVKHERGVLLSETSSRLTDDEVARTAFTQAVFTGTRIPQRHPLGTVASITSASPSALRRFYEAWYRPERMMIVIVGDLEVVPTETSIRAIFADLVARGAVRREPELGSISKLEAPTVTVHEESRNAVNTTFAFVRPRPDQPPTLRSLFEGLCAFSAASMLERRLARFAESPDAVIAEAWVNPTRAFLQFRVLSVGFGSSVVHLNGAVTLAEQELRRALQFGFEQNELDWQKDQLRRSASAMAARAESVESSIIADELAESWIGGERFTFVSEILPQQLGMIDRLTSDDCRDALRNMVGDQPPHIFVRIHPEYAARVDNIAAVYADSRRQPVAPPEAFNVQTFAYDTFGEAGAVAEKVHVADLDLWLVRFANGVRLNLKRTPFETGHVRLSIRFGNGRIAEPVDKPGLGLWIFALWFGGTGKHSFADFSRMAGGFPELNLSAGDSAFEFTLEGPSAKLPSFSRQIAAVFADPAFRAEGWPKAQAMLRGIIDPLWRQPEGVVQQLIRPALAGGDLRVGVPGDAVLYARTPDEFRAWIEPQVVSGPIEIAIVGDIDVDATIHEIAQSFGALPPRVPAAIDSARTDLPLVAGPVSTYFFYQGSADRPSTLSFFWPVRDSLTPVERHPLSLLANILESRVSEQIRDKRGATYSPAAFLDWNATYPTFNFIRCTLDVAPGEAVRYGNEVRDLATRLAEKGVKKDELARAKAQHLAAARAAKTSNQAWLTNVLSRAQQQPQQLDDARTREAAIDSASVENINALARRFLRPGLLFRYIIDPDARMPKADK